MSPHMKGVSHFSTDCVTLSGDLKEFLQSLYIMDTEGTAPAEVRTGVEIMS